MMEPLARVTRVRGERMTVLPSDRVNVSGVLPACNVSPATTGQLGTPGAGLMLAPRSSNGLLDVTVPSCV